MPRPRKILPAILGDGELHYRGLTELVAYAIQGEPSTLRLGPSRLRGSLSATSEVAEAVFHAGEAELRLQDGGRFRITLLGHTAGSEVAYFEMRI